jgi:hypothetical protein
VKADCIVQINLTPFTGRSTVTRQVNSVDIKAILVQLRYQLTVLSQVPLGIFAVAMLQQ